MQARAVLQVERAPALPLAVAEQHPGDDEVGPVLLRGGVGGDVFAVPFVAGEMSAGPGGVEPAARGVGLGEPARCRSKGARKRPVPRGPPR